jgi:hypothetical protein
MKNKNRIIICCLIISSALVGIFYFWWQNRKPVLVENIIGSVQVVSSGKTKDIKEKPFEISVGDKILTGSGSIAGIDFGQNQIKTISEKREITLVDVKDTVQGGKHYKFLENGQTWEHVTTQTSSVTAAIVGWNNSSTVESDDINITPISKIINSQEVLGINEDFSQNSESRANENRFFTKDQIEQLKKCITENNKTEKQKPESQQQQIDDIFRECLRSI